MIHIPTTILAAFDSVISLKRAVKASYAKNAIGGCTISPLVFTALQHALLRAHSRDIRSSLCEAIKNTLSIFHSEISLIILPIQIIFIIVWE